MLSLIVVVITIDIHSFSSILIYLVYRYHIAFRLIRQSGIYTYCIRTKNYHYHYYVHYHRFDIIIIVVIINIIFEWWKCVCLYKLIRKSIIKDLFWEM